MTVALSVNQHAGLSKQRCSDSALLWCITSVGGEGALRAVHGDTTSGAVDYYLADEIAGTYRGMMIAIRRALGVFATMTTANWSGC